MLCELNIELEKNEDDFFTQNISSLFHGVIMEKIEKSYADIMHISQIRPYRQSLQIERTRILWTICSVTEESYKNIIGPLMDDGFDKVYLNQKNKEFPIISKRLKKISIDDFLHKTFFEEGCRQIKISFLSPCSFKTDGKYLFYPTVHHIMQSLAMKFEETRAGISVYTPELIENFESNISVIQYNLKSRSFQMEGIKIPAFSGEIILKINGPGQFVNLVNMLLFFGEYCGIGIKCALGMGAVKIEKRSVCSNGRR